MAEVAVHRPLRTGAADRGGFCDREGIVPDLPALEAVTEVAVMLHLVSGMREAGTGKNERRGQDRNNFV